MFRRLLAYYREDNERIEYALGMKAEDIVRLRARRVENVERIEELTKCIEEDVD
ncbi:hypothetical protein D3C73_1540700 [compost metagenome]